MSDLLACDHCHHGRADGVRVGWSPARLVWEACEEEPEKHSYAEMAEGDR